MRDITGIPFAPLSVYIVPEFPTDAIRRIATCHLRSDAEDIATALHHVNGKIYLSTDLLGVPLVHGNQRD